MEYSSPLTKGISALPSTAALGLAIAVICLLASITGLAQTTSAASLPAIGSSKDSAASSRVISHPEVPKAGPPAATSTSATVLKPNGNNDKSGNDFKSSPTVLSTLYQSEVERLEKQNNQSKALFDAGLISRRDLEASDKALADARARVEENAKQIASANQTSLVSTSQVSALGASERPWTTGHGKIDGLINYYGHQYGVDPYLIYCLMSQESRFSMNATSGKGAQGLMQLMPATAARYGITNPYDVAQSIMGGTRYLKDLLKMFNGRIDLALAGYNAGENAVIKYGYNVPPYQETRNYVRLITARYGKKQS